MAIKERLCWIAGRTGVAMTLEISSASAMRRVRVIFGRGATEVIFTDGGMCQWTEYLCDCEKLLGVLLKWVGSSLPLASDPPLGSDLLLDDDRAMFGLLATKQVDNG